jgi:hypothetical protein
MTNIRKEFEKCLSKSSEGMDWFTWQAAHASRDAEVAELKMRVEVLVKALKIANEYLPSIPQSYVDELLFKEKVLANRQDKGE